MAAQGGEGPTLLCAEFHSHGSVVTGVGCRGSAGRLCACQGFNCNGDLAGVGVAGSQGIECTHGHFFLVFQKLGV